MRNMVKITIELPDVLVKIFGSKDKLQEEVEKTIREGSLKVLNELSPERLKELQSYV